MWPCQAKDTELEFGIPPAQASHYTSALTELDGEVGTC